MPYIAPNVRDQLDPILDQLPVKDMDRGALCYVIYRAMKQWVFKGRYVNYTVLSAAIAASMDAAAEFRRRVLDPYEDEARRLRGDVEV